MVADHEEFRSREVQNLLFAPRQERLLVLDSPGLFSDWQWPDGVEYFRAGAANWLDHARDVNVGAD